MRREDHSERWRVLSADDAEITQALAELEEKAREWLAGLAALTALGVKWAKLREADRAATGQAAPAPAPLVTQPRTPPPAPAEPPPVTGVNEPERPDDEALLEGLDPEVANAVRVRRRLLGPSADIRKLIAEVEAGRGSKREPSKRNTWWR